LKDFRQLRRVAADRRRALADIGKATDLARIRKARRAEAGRLFALIFDPIELLKLPGMPERHTHTYVRHGIMSLFAA
jgi:hypothetical protein